MNDARRKALRRQTITGPARRAFARTAALAVGGFALLAVAPAITHATFPGHNGRLAYESGSNEIETINPDGSAKRALGDGDNLLGDPSYSADGQRLAMHLNVTPGADLILWAMNADGSGEESLAGNDRSGRLGRSPAFSPDGRRVVYVTPESYDRESGQENRRIAVVDVDATVFQASLVLTPDQWDSANPSYSPDGSRVVFGASLWGDDPGTMWGRDIFTMDPDGTDKVNLTRNPSRVHAYASFSPDGSKIAYSRSREPANNHDCNTDCAPADMDVWVMNADGSDPRRVATKGNEPVFSPDGKWIAFSASDGRFISKDTVDVIRADGSGRRTLAGKKFRPKASPTWQPLSAPSSACTDSKAKRRKLARKVKRLKRKRSRADTRRERRRYGKRLKKTRKSVKKARRAARYNC